MYYFTDKLDIRLEAFHHKIVPTTQQSRDARCSNAPVVLVRLICIVISFKLHSCWPQWSVYSRAHVVPK